MTGQLKITEIIRQYAPRDFKANQYSRRNRYSMTCPLPGHEGDRQHPDGSGSFSVDETDNLYKCFGCGAHPAPTPDAGIPAKGRRVYHGGCEAQGEAVFFYGGKSDWNQWVS